MHKSIFRTLFTVSKYYSSKESEGRKEKGKNWGRKEIEREGVGKRDRDVSISLHFARLSINKTISCNLSVLKC